MHLFSFENVHLSGLHLQVKTLSINDRVKGKSSGKSAQFILLSHLHTKDKQFNLLRRDDSYIPCLWHPQWHWITIWVLAGPM